VLTEEKPSAETAQPVPIEAQEQNELENLFSSSTQSQTPLTLQGITSPDRLYVGEIFPLTIKLTPTELASGDVEYTLQNDSGLRVFSQTPQRSIKEDGVYDTFYFLVQSGNVRLPDITVTLTSTGSTSQTLTGSSLIATTLNPPATYANVLADSFKITNYKTTAYNQESNIVVFSAVATRCNLDAFSLSNALKQGFESKASSVNTSQMTYYAIIPNNASSLEFTVFNLKKNRYESVTIPIVVDDDTVSTQSDLSPTDVRHTELKIGASVIVALLFFALYYWRRYRSFLIIALLPLFYIVYIFFPNNNVCIRKNAPIQILPITHGTVFKVTTEEATFEDENRVGVFIKIRLGKDKVGWVNEKDICSN
jgi:hypothetical protein